MTLLAMVIGVAWRWARIRIAFWVPLLGIAAQLGVTALVMHLNSLAGPIS